MTTERSFLPPSAPFDEWSRKLTEEEKKQKMKELEKKLEDVARDLYGKKQQQGNAKPAPSFTESFDARDWAKAFIEYVKANPSIATDEMTMTGWFANAIMRGYDEAVRRAS